MKKRIFTIALLCALLLAVPPWAQAAGTLTVTTVSGEIGDHAAVEVGLTSEDVCSGSFKVLFDSSKLRLVSAERGDGSWFGTVHEQAPGVVHVGFAQATPLTDAVLCRLTFEVLAETPAGGTVVSIAEELLYNEDARLTDADLVFGTVSRDCVWFTLKNADTVAGQGVRAEVHMSGTMQPCGGNFVLQYDPDVLRATGVVALGGLKNSRVTSNLEEEGIVRIAFAGEQPTSAGGLCAVVFQAVGPAGSASAVELTEVYAFDENSDAMDTEVTSGEIGIVIPSESAPKLWVTGGAMDGEGNAMAAVVLQGRGVVCGGQFTLQYDRSMDVAIEARHGVEYSHSPETGEIHISWAQESPSVFADPLVTLTFPNAVESDLTFGSDVLLFDENSSQIGEVDIRNGALISVPEQVRVVVDAVLVKAEEKASEVSIDIDIADVTMFVREEVEKVIAMLALYDGDQLVGFDAAPAADMDSGVSEISLSAKCGRQITGYTVFVLDKANAPLASALRQR